eukprot:TRINITY_DN56174_c1_g2_i1.p1 TRINITY_DN56174_c1_g2~~TRINITY_DN56174_c1_g2_i1.p1  ORF type:complete len:210 (-),score=26.56 TRINITY_DN56174_c1_g2_i1:372-1001(-)
MRARLASLGIKALAAVGLILSQETSSNRQRTARSEDDQSGVTTPTTPEPKPKPSYINAKKLQAQWATFRRWRPTWWSKMPELHCCRIKRRNRSPPPVDNQERPFYDVAAASRPPTSPPSPSSGYMPATASAPSTPGSVNTPPATQSAQQQGQVYAQEGQVFMDGRRRVQTGRAAPTGRHPATPQEWWGDGGSPMQPEAQPLPELAGQPG